MTSAQKVAVSLLVTIVAFAIFTVIAFTGLFSLLDTRFYEPAKVNGIRKQLDAAADASETYINSLIKKFASGDDAYLSNSAVMSYFDSTPSDENVEARANATGNLLAETQGLDGIRIVASNGRNVHFSTYSNDIIRQNENMRMYRDYVDLQMPAGGEEIQFEQVSAPDNLNSDKNYKLTFDAVNNRIIFAFPFYDSYSAYRGTALFYVNAFDFNRALSIQNIVPLQYNCTLVVSEDKQKAGFVFGLPAIGSDLIRQEIIKSWNAGSVGPDKIINIATHPESQISKTGDNYWVLLTSTHVPFLYLAGVYRDTEFTMLPAARIMLLVCVFITLFLIIFMAFSFKNDDMVIIRDRIRRLQYAIINEYLDKREKVDWAEVSKQISGRKHEVSARIKKSLGKRAQSHEAETDALIDRSWNEIIGALGIATPNTSSSVDVTQIKKILEEILSSGNIQVKSSAAQPDNSFVATPVTGKAPAQTADVTSDLEEINSLEEVETLEDGDDLEEIEPLEEVPEELEDVESLEEVDALEDAETLEEIELLEDVPEELEDVEPLEEVETLEDGDDLEDIEPLEDIPEELEDVEPLEEVDALEDAETLEDIEPLEDIPEELEDVEPLEKAETLGDINPAEDVPLELMDDGIGDSAANDNIKLLEKIVDEIEEIPIEIEDIDAIEDADVVDSVEAENKNITRATAESSVKLFDDIGKAKNTSDAIDEKNTDHDAATHAAHANGDSFFTVTPVSLDFSGLDDLMNDDTSRKVPMYNRLKEKSKPKSNAIHYEQENINIAPVNMNKNATNVADVDDNIFDVQAVSKKTRQFNFTGFKTFSNIDGELAPYVPEVIFEDENGIFHISDDLIYGDVQQDDSFSNLVNSVLSTR